MSIRKTIIATVAALALVAAIAPVSAGAVTIEELQAQIQALLAQLTQLQSGTATTGGAPAVCAGVTFTRNLTVGSTGSDVKCLQAILNQSASTQVATTGAGSPGNETTYFGSRTLAAVKIYQANHGWTPANQVGPLTRAALNSTIAGGTTVTPGQPPVVVPTGAGLTVQLAYNNPAAGTVILAQGLAPLAKFTLTNGDNVEVKVTNFKANRIGVSLDTTLANVYLFNGAKRLTDAATVSSGVVTFNDAAGLFTIPAGGSVTITVAADLSATAGQTLGVSINAATSVTTNASSVKGTFPINGNLMTAATATGAGVQFTATTTPTTNTSLIPQNDYVVWQNSAVITTRAVDFTRIAFKEIGSVKTADLQNFRLHVDGVQVGSAIANLDANNYVTFDLTGSPKRMEAGSRVIKLVADIIGGSSLNFKFRVSVSADANFVDTQYNVNTAPTTATTSGSFTVADVTSGVQTIASGTLTFTKKTDSPSGDVVNTASNATLGKFTLTAAGERVKVESLYVRIIFTNVTGTDDCTASSTICTTAASMLLRNGMLLANGVQIGSTTAISPVAAGTLFSPGSSLIVEPGSPVTLEVRGDIYDATGTYNDIDSTDTLQVRIVAGSSNAQGLVSLSTLSTPAANTDGNILTVKTGGLTLSKYTAYTTQSMVPPLTAAKIAHFTLTANTTEAVNVSTIEANLNNVVSTYATNLYVTFGTDTTSVKPTISQASNSWSVNYTLAAGQTKDLIVYADINSYAGGTGYVSVYVSGTTGSSATTVSYGLSGSYDSTACSATAGCQGQAIAFTTGTFTPAVDGTTPLAAIVAGGQEITAAKFKFTSLYESYTIKELRFIVNQNSNAANNSAAIISLVLKDGSTVLATVPYDSTSAYFNITGLSVSVPANTTKVLTVALNLSTGISSSTSTSQVDVQPDLDYIKYANSQGAETTSGTDYDTAKAVYAFKSIPIVAKDTTITGGAVTAGTPDLNLYGWKVTATSPNPNASVAVKQTKLTLSWSDAGDTGTLYLYAFKLYKNGSDITSLVTITDEDGHDLETTTAANGANEDSTTVIINWNVDPYEDTIAAGATATYKLTATASGFTATASKPGTDTVSVSMPADTTVNTGKYLTNSAQGDPDDFIELCTSAEASDSTDANFIWSDVSDLSHDASESEDDNGTASTSSDWSNGYLIQSLPLSTNTFIGP